MYTKQFSSWWTALETDSDNQKINASVFKPKPSLLQKSTSPITPQRTESKVYKTDLKPRKLELDFANDTEPSSTKPFKKCIIVKEAIKKLHKFLTSSHKNGCVDCSCKYDSNHYKLKLFLKKFDFNQALPQKRGRKKISE